MAKDSYGAPRIEVDRDRAPTGRRAQRVDIETDSATTDAIDDPLAACARAGLMIPLAEGNDDSLFQRATRIQQAARWIADLPDLSSQRCDRRALAAAAWFHDACWAEAVREGRVARTAILLSPTDVAQRERSAEILLRDAAEVLAEPSRTTAARAIREAGRRTTTMPEATALVEAVELEGIGPTWMWYEARRCVHLGRDVLAVVERWQEQQRYGYWEARVRERLRFEPTRLLARRRLAALRDFMTALAETCGLNGSATGET